MSTRIDTASLIPGATVIGYRGLGALGSTILLTTADGDNGPGILYNDVQPGDESKEFRAFVAKPPAGLALAEDGTFIYSGQATTFDYRLYVDGVSIGTATATLNTAAAPAAVFLSGTSSVVFTATADVTVGAAPAAVTLDGTASIVFTAAADITVDAAPAAVMLAGAAVVACTAAASITVGAVQVSTPLQGYSSALRTVTVYADLGAPIKRFTKQPGERLDYRFDFARWLADCGDAIASQSITCPAPLHLAEVARMDGSIVAMVDGGESGKSQKLTCTITTTGGRIKEADIIINVHEG